MSHDEHTLPPNQRDAHGATGAEMRADPPPLAAMSKPLGRPVVAWLIIAATLAVIMLLTREKPDLESSISTSPSSVRSPVLELMGKYVVGATQLPGITGQQMYKEFKSLNGGSLPNRLCFVGLAGELAGADEALVQLEVIRAEIKHRRLIPAIEQTEAIDLLGRLYSDHGQQATTSSLSVAERDQLRDQLGWFGELALAPAGSPDRAARDSLIAQAQRTFVTILCAAVAVGMLGVAGFAALVAFVVLTAKGQVRSRIAGDSRYGGVYAETFAVWFVMLLALSFLVEVIPWGPENLPLRQAAVVLSLTALAWPVLRGVTWRQVREDIGWSKGRGVLIEMMWGAACYVSTLPLLFLGVILVLLLMRWTGVAGDGAVDPQGLPTHPIVNWVAESSWWDRLLIFLLATVVAPFTEETMFRGVLYRHLRDWTVRWRTSASVLISSLVNSFLFAVIHPQGLVAVPALMALAVGFSLTREWRGSLLASMTGHGLQNGLSMLVLLTVM